MRVRLLLLIAIGVGALAATPEQIGPYRLAAIEGGIELRAPDDTRGGSALIAAGLALTAIGAWRLRRDAGERRNFGWARVLLGLGMAVVGAFAVFGSGMVWTVTRDGVALRDGARSETIAPRAQIEAVEIAHVPAEGAAVKNLSSGRDWTVRAGGARFTVGSQEEARQLADEIARALGVAVRGR
jgi:hypothetical protein